MVDERPGLYLSILALHPLRHPLPFRPPRLLHVLVHDTVDHRVGSYILPRDLAADAKKKVVTLVERDGSARSFHVANVRSKTVRDALVTTADRASRLMTDGATVYTGVGGEFAAHSAVDHSAGEYVRGIAHSNTAENFFSILKRGINGTFIHVSEAHLSRYLAEFDFRYNHRSGLGIEDTERTNELLRNVAGKRLTYRSPDKAAYA